LQQNPDVRNREKNDTETPLNYNCSKEVFAKSGGAASNIEKAYRERLQHQLFLYSDPLQILCSSNSSTVEEEGNQQPSLDSSVNYLPKSGNSRKTP
jgi:hypothetical protein